jgi:hypothetical protein
MKYTFSITVAILILSLKLNAQNIKIKKPSEFYSKDKTEVLVVGTFHFSYPNLDTHKVSEKDQVDVLKEPKKSELTELVNYIKKFKPNKIAIEAYDSYNATQKLRDYKNGLLRNDRDERYQLGVRIASEMSLDTIYSIDSEELYSELDSINPKYRQEIFKGYDYINDEPIYSKNTKKWWEHGTKLSVDLELIDYFKYINSKEFHQHDFGSYLIGDFKINAERGADALSLYWINRNLRMFRKVQKMTDNTHDRILILVGNSHAAIFRQLFISSPEYKFIEFNKI